MLAKVLYKQSSHNKQCAYKTDFHFTST